ncbi:hypothetical protein [Streptomyces thermolilacinus]|uniref:hypothetical protein n=1 Tax=Streptomyces thermolilacinus TaxID=285540 RepID=UPI0034061D1D
MNRDPVVFIAEEKDAEQFGHLPPDIAVALTWQEPPEASLRALAVMRESSWAVRRRCGHRPR